jgi:hypothetical protein
MEYKSIYKYVYECLRERYDEIDSEWTELDKAMNEAINNGKGEYTALKNLAVCYGRLKMLGDVIRFMKVTELGMAKEYHDHKCRDCKWLSNEKSCIGRKCVNPDRKWKTTTAMWHQPSTKACKAFEEKGGKT